MTFKKTLLALISALVLTLAIGCSNISSEDKASEKLTLKVGVMPAVDSAPIFLAAEKGYFDELGIDVEVQIYNNAMNRQSALQSGELDGAMTDVIALVNNVENGFDIKITTSTDGVFPFLINKDYDGSKDVTVGMMEVSVSNYLADISLEGYNVEKIYINEIPARLEMVGKGALDMAVIPEPMASKGEMNGLIKKVIENTDEFSPDIMVFTSSAIAEKEEAIKKFHKAYNKAVEVINKDNSLARDILISKLELGAEIKDNIILPTYNKARVPSEAYLKGIMEWNEKVLGKKVSLEYTSLVEDKFVND